MTDLDVAVPLDAAPELRLVPYAYEKVFGDVPTGVWQAAGGLSILGSPGARFALAIPVRWGAVVAAGPQPDGLIELRSMNRPALHYTTTDPAAEPLPTWAAPTLHIARALGDAGQASAGTRLLLHTDLPYGCGIPCDAALTTAVAEAFGAIFGATVALSSLAAVGDVAAQLASRSCPDATAVLVDRERMAVEHVPFDLGSAGLRLMLIDVGCAGPGGCEGDGQGSAKEAAARVRSGDLAGIGPLLGHPGGEPDNLAAVVVAARRAGALGAGLLPVQTPMAPACLIALVPVPAVVAVRTAVGRTWTGTRPPRLLTTTATRGGRPVSPAQRDA